MLSGKVLDTEQKGKIKIFSSQGYHLTGIGRLIFKSDKVVRNFLKDMETYGTKLTGGPEFMIEGCLLSRILRYLDKEPLSIPEIIDYLVCRHGLAPTHTPKCAFSFCCPVQQFLSR